MQFRDLKKQYQVLKEDIDKGIQVVCENANFISGTQVNELEQQLAEYVGVKYCVTCGNGTDALSMALMAWDVKEGDAVFVPDFTFFASGEVVSFEGATPIFYDVDKATFNSDPNSLREAIETVKKEGKLNLKAIIAVDLFGLPANYPEIRKIAEEYNMLVLEDGAQGFGGEINGKKACSFGDIATTSFFPAKPLGCYGDGGAIFTNNEEWYNYLISIRVHGKGTMKYDNVRIGWNSRLDTIQAAILLPKFKAFKEYEVTDVNNVAKAYTQKIKESGLDIITPTIPNGYLSSWAQYTIRLQDEKTRNELQISLKNEGIPSMVYYPKPMHEQKAFENTDCIKNDLNNSKELCAEVLSLPMHPYMNEEDIDLVVGAIKSFFDKQ